MEDIKVSEPYLIFNGKMMDAAYYDWSHKFKYAFRQVIKETLLKNSTDTIEETRERPSVQREFDERSYFQLESGVMHQTIDASSFIEIDIE